MAEGLHSFFVAETQSVRTRLSWHTLTPAQARRVDAFRRSIKKSLSHLSVEKSRPSRAHERSILIQMMTKSKAVNTKLEPRQARLASQDSHHVPELPTRVAAPERHKSP